MTTTPSNDAELERRLRELEELGEPDWDAVPADVREHFGLVVGDLAQRFPAPADATPEQFAELGHDEATRIAFLQAVRSRAVEEEVRRRLAAGAGEPVAALVAEHAPRLPAGLADTLLRLLRIELGERAIPALRRVAEGPGPGAATATELLRELGHGPPLRVVAALDDVPSPDPLRSWLAHAAGPDPRLYDIADALVRADGGPQQLVLRGPYDVPYPFAVRVRRSGEGARVELEFAGTDDPPLDLLQELVRSAGRMLGAEAVVAGPGADLDAALAAAREARAVPRALWVSGGLAPGVAAAEPLAWSAQAEPGGGRLLLGR